MGQTTLSNRNVSTFTPGEEPEEEKTKTVSQHHQQTHTSHTAKEVSVQSNKTPHSSKHSTIDTAGKLSNKHERKDSKKKVSGKCTRPRAGQNADEQPEKADKRQNAPQDYKTAYGDHLRNMHRAQAIHLLRRAAAARRPAIAEDKHKEARRLLKYTSYDSDSTTTYTDRYTYRRRRSRFSLGRFVRRHAAGLAGALLFVVASTLVGRYIEARRLLRKRIAGRKSLAPDDLPIFSTCERPAFEAISYRDLLRQYEEQFPPCPPAPAEIATEQPEGRLHIGPRDPTPVRATSRRELEWPYSDADPAVEATGVLENVFDISPRFFPDLTE